MHELELENELIMHMVVDSTRNMKSSVSPLSLKVLKSDSYGPHKHRTWIFSSPGGEVVGSIERYWGGLKIIVSVFGGAPRTCFFTEDGQRSTNKGLKEAQQQ